MAKQSQTEKSMTFKGEVEGTEVPIATGWDDDGLKLTPGEANVLFGRPQSFDPTGDREFMRQIRQSED